MKKNGAALAAFLGAAGLCLGQALHYAPLLPERMASHFGPGGTPNGWMPRGAFINLNVGVVGFMILTFLLTARKMRTLDVSNVNLPNKDYWMAPERREETVEFLSSYFLLFGAATLLLLLDVFHQVFRYNLFLSHALEHPGASLAVYVAFAFAWIAGFQLRFRK
jgi:uncharacterized membrane protein